MKITFLGQAGLMLETQSKIILIDPYLSDSVAKHQSHNIRRVAVDEGFLKIKPNIILCTHNHLDHTDKEALCHYLTENSRVLVLAPLSAWQEVRKFGGNNNFVMFNNGSTWTEDGVMFRAVKAEHSDKYAIGVIVTAEEKNYYITGDTLYSELVFDSLPSLQFEAVFLPVNGVGNNMNFADAKKFAERLNVKHVVPIHTGLFDDLDANNLQIENKVVPTIYKEIIL